MTINYRYLFAAIIVFVIAFIIKSNDTPSTPVQKPKINVITHNSNKAPVKPSPSPNPISHLSKNIDLPPPPPPPETLSLFDSEKQAEMDAKHEAEKIAKAQQALFNASTSEVDFQPNTDINYRQKFSQSKKVLFNVRALNEDYQLTLKRTNAYTDGGDWYSGYVEGTDIKTRVKAFADKVTVYIYKPEGKIKISKTLNERQRYMDNRNKSKDQDSQSSQGAKSKTKSIKSSFYETQNDYYVISERKDDIYQREVYQRVVSPNGVNYENDTISPSDQENYQ